MMVLSFIHFPVNDMASFLWMNTILVYIDFLYQFTYGWVARLFPELSNCELHTCKHEYAGVTMQ